MQLSSFSAGEAEKVKIARLGLPVKWLHGWPLYFAKATGRPLHFANLLYTMFIKCSQMLMEALGRQRGLPNVSKPTIELYR